MTIIRGFMYLKKLKWSKPVALKKESITPEFILKQQLKGRFVKYSIQSISKIPVGSNGEGNTPWTFIDELILFFK